MPTEGLIQPGVTENITVTICCIGTGRVELVGCLFVGTESFQTLNGSYEALGPFYFGYDCLTPSSSQCPSSPPASLVLANWCATPNQSRALTASNAGDWGLLLGAFGIDGRGLCIIDEFENGVHPLLRVAANINRLPIPYDFRVLNFYLQKTFESNPSSPILYNVTVVPVNSTIANSTSITIPNTGLLEDNSIRYFNMSLICNASGETPVSLQFNFTAFKDGFLLYDSYDLYFIKNCTPPPGNSTMTRTGPNVALIVPVTVVPVIVVTVIVVIIVLVIVGVARRQKIETEQLEQYAKDQASKNLYTMTAVSNPFEFLDQYEIEYNFALLEVIDQLGEGAFGRVYKARAPGLHRGDYKAAEFVAVKSLKDDGLVDEFCKEVKVCVQFEHDNVIRLLGVCTASAQKCMIFEYMDCGSLHDMLHKSDSNNPSYYDPNSSSFLLRPDHLLPIAIQLSRGLEYLATLNFVHRDIATRNCLIDSSLNAKIADFGLSRDISAQNYYRVGGAKAYMPVRWMPPEALLYGKFTLKSDVWSFAVLIWEMYTFGQLPYTGISDHEAIDCVKEARGLEHTPLCPLGVYSIMRTCWTRVPSRRPTMEQVRQQLEAFSEGKQTADTSYVNLAPTQPPLSYETTHIEADTDKLSNSLNINQDHHDAVRPLEPPALAEDDGQIKDSSNN